MSRPGIRSYLQGDLAVEVAWHIYTNISVTTAAIMHRETGSHDELNLMCFWLPKTRKLVTNTLSLKLTLHTPE